jgi:DHA1 family bicyclomycin/chloramphenicol resistance-like MFS transporter
MNQESGKNRSGQKILGNGGLMVLLVLLSAFVPLSTDLYLPALPTMTDYFAVPAVLTNLTIILFFVFFSISMLVWGPLSDKYGRRPILIIGLVGYSIASFFCAVSTSVYMLIVFRVIQAVGAGAATATSMAIIKDVYTGKGLERKLAVLQTISVICPVVAPMLGALILKLTDWRGTFYAELVLGLIVIVFSLLFTETLREKGSGGILRTMGRLFIVLKDKKFTVLLLIFSLSGITFMAFVASSAYIYQGMFGLSGQAYSYFFAFNAASTVLGPLLYVGLSGRFSRFSLISVSFIITILSGILVSVFGSLNPFVFAATLLPATVMGSFVAPPSRYLLLSQHEGDTGSASALINAISAIAGSAGMMVASLPMGNLVLVIGILNIFIGVLCGGAWLFFTSRPFLRDIRGK